jgi:Protein of unknown function (DUF1236)
MQRVTRFGLALCAVLLIAVPGYGQVPNPGVPAGTRTVNLTLEQRHVIRELVKELKVAPAKDDLKLAAGDEIPGTATLQPVPPLIGQKVPSIKSHRLYVTQSQILIVDPQDQKVVEVIE